VRNFDVNSDRLRFLVVDFNGLDFLVVFDGLGLLNRSRLRSITSTGAAGGRRRRSRAITLNGRNFKSSYSLGLFVVNLNGLDFLVVFDGLGLLNRSRLRSITSTGARRRR
jgi:hypothetical protein